MLENILAMGLGLIITLGILAVVLIIVSMETKTRRMRQKMIHDERMLALEKGQPIPMDLGDTAPKRKPYTRGMVFCAIGIGLMFLSDEGIGVGAIVLLIGLALVIGDKIAEGRHKKKTDYPSSPPPSSPNEYQSHPS